VDFKTISTSQAIAGIPVAHYNSHLSNFENYYKDKSKDLFKKLENVASTLLDLNIKKCPRYVFLCGVAGSGKSHFMVGLYRAMVAKLGYGQGDGALFIPFMDLAKEIIVSFADKIFTREALSGYLQSSYLFVDDFTASERVFKEGSLEFQIFRDILIDRYESELTLVTSSNLNAEDLLSELDRMFGGYVTSRLSASILVQFPDIDLRKVVK